MELNIATDQFGRLVCSVSDGSSPAIVTASHFGQACDDLAGAMKALETNGIGECYWAEAGGDYRWVFRREGDRARVAVLWSTGVVTGWEHVFWTECDYPALLAAVRRELARAATPAA